MNSTKALDGTWPTVQCLDLIYQIFNCQVCISLVLFHLALHLSAKSTFGSFQGLVVNNELSIAIGVDCLVALLLFRVAIRV